MLTVKQLKESLEGVNDDVVVCVDTEARCFNAHLIEINGAFFQDDTEIGLGEDLFILSPSYEGTTHYRDKVE